MICRITCHPIRHILLLTALTPRRVLKKDTSPGLCWRRRQFGRQWLRQAHSFPSTRFSSRKTIKNVRVVCLFRLAFVATWLTTSPRSPTCSDNAGLAKLTDLTKPQSKSLSQCYAFSRNFSLCFCYCLNAAPALNCTFTWKGEQMIRCIRLIGTAACCYSLPNCGGVSVAIYQLFHWIGVNWFDIYRHISIFNNYNRNLNNRI